MAHSRAPHPLAEAICELAGPALLQPTILRMQAEHNVQAEHGGWASLTVAAYISPQRAPAAGLEIAVYSGRTETDEGDASKMRLDGHVYTMSQTAAAMKQFAGDLIATVASPDAWDMNEFGYFNCFKLMLPQDYDGFHGSWNFVRLDLFSATEAITERLPDEHGQRLFRLKLPMDFHLAYRPLAAAFIRNSAGLYRDKQLRLAQAAAMVGDKGEAPPKELPDSAEVQALKYRRLREEVMDGLHSALQAMLRQALRYRGYLPFPGVGELPAAPAEPPAPEAAN